MKNKFLWIFQNEEKQKESERKKEKKKKRRRKRKRKRKNFQTKALTFLGIGMKLVQIHD